MNEFSTNVCWVPTEGISLRMSHDARLGDTRMYLDTTGPGKDYTWGVIVTRETMRDGLKMIRLLESGLAAIRLRQERDARFVTRVYDRVLRRFRYWRAKWRDRNLTWEDSE